MKLAELICDLKVTNIDGNTNIDIKNISYDSRKVKDGCLFVCIEGFKTDGHDYVDIALKNGAIAILATKKIKVPEHITVIYVDDSRDATSFIANRFFSNPSKDLKLIGITGTKGKTTISYMIKSIFESNGSKVGLIGTIANLIGDEIIPTERTTPESLDLQKLFRDMIDKGADSCVMEVSSHALYLKRVEYSDFKVGIFSNLSRDHLDFHKDFDDYFEAKARLFSMSQIGIVNIDNSYGEKLAKIAKCKILTVSIEKDADIRAINVIKHKDSVEFDVVSSHYNGKIFINIPGLFTVYNALCAIGAAMTLGIPFEKVELGLKEVKVAGRAEIVQTNENYTVMVDYAHTPDSLENILSSVKQFAKGRVVSVFGCGGDRDKTKRPIMGEISGKIANYTIITSDNPRTEVPIQIIKEIEEGIRATGSDYTIIEDRRLAIKFAIENAQKNDVIVIAGKGHETYQDFGDKKIDFDERKVVKEILNEISTQ